MSVTRFAVMAEARLVAIKRLFMRAELNVSHDDCGAISKDTLVHAWPRCTQIALAAGVAVMVTSHLRRPTEGEFKPVDSLVLVSKNLAELLGCEVPLAPYWVNGVRVKGQPVHSGQMVLPENCRVNTGEKKRSACLQTCGAFSIAGGGDTLAAIAKYGLGKVVSCISTGGGIFLEVLKATHCRRLRSCIGVQRVNGRFGLRRI